MATKMKRLSLHLRTVLLLVWTLACGGDGYSCPYGQACGFEPSPPGRFPNCALPGLTYCVHPDPYPERLIRQLLEIGSYDVRTLLSDESREDFGARKGYPYGYGPNSIPNVDQISLVNDVYPKNYNKFNNRFNNDIFTQNTPLQPPSPIDPTPYNINSYQATNFSNFGFQGYQPNLWNPNKFNNNNYNKKVYRQNNVNPNYGGYDNSFFPAQNQNSQNYDSTNDWLRQASNGVTQYNPSEWWKYLTPSRIGSDVSIQGLISLPIRTPIRSPARRKRNAELVKAAAQRQLTGAEALSIALGLTSDETSAERSRRQADGVEQLCSVRTEYITPRAALNNKGSWRYVVNMPTNTTQLVKVEICASSECGGLCSVPPGYTTRCEQKYIQKRLVALQANGQNLYTDVFWIPSCCQCTVIRN